MSGKVEAKTVHEFKASAERVFDAWLDPLKVRSWGAQPVPGMPSFDIRRVEIDARVGGKFTFSDMREEGEAVHWGYYLEIDRPRKLVFTWFTSEEEEQENSSVVTLTIEPLANGCRATNRAQHGCTLGRICEADGDGLGLHAAPDRHGFRGGRKRRLEQRPVRGSIARNDRNGSSSPGRRR